MSVESFRPVLGRLLSVVCCALMWSMSGVSAHAATAIFSGPSVAKLATNVKFDGKGFVANASVTVMVKAPGGASAGYSAVTAADGSFSYSFTPTLAGAYTVTVTDSGGNALASAVVLASN